MKARTWLYIILWTAIIAAVTACSTTKRLEEGEVLYTGVKHFKVLPEKNQKVPTEVQDALFTAINVHPNNCWYSPYLRSPFPIGLWVYNNWSVDTDHGLKHWIYDKLVEQPVLISFVKPKTRVQMMKDILDNNGYFAASVKFDLLPDKHNAKKARIDYTVNLNEPYLFSRVEHLGGDSPIEHKIDSLAMKLPYLKQGQRYCTDSLSAARISITNQLRNEGYFYFRPEFIEFLADSTMQPGSIAMKLSLSKNIEKAAMKQYYTRHIVTTVSGPGSAGVLDTVKTERGIVIKNMPVRLSDGLIPSCLGFRPGRLFKVRAVDRTQMYLSRLGIFSGINIDATPLDSLDGSDSIDVHIACVLDKPMEASFEIQATSKSNSYIGPGAVFGLKNKNLFGGGEQLTTELTTSYEWQTGNGGRDQNSAAFNSYEFGLKSTLSFPRLLAPRFVDRTRRYINWTKVSASGDILNRLHFFKMVQFGGSFSWEWHANKFSTNEFTPFKLTYTKLLTTTEAFDTAMADNRAVALSFRNQFVPQMSYSYTFDKMINADNGVTWSSSVTEAGNIFSGIWGLAGSHGTKRLFGTPFSQFIKGQTQIVYSRRLTGDHWMVSRAMVGAAYAYGNSDEVPYSEQFYIGGANSVRAFAVRSIGPGSYHPVSTTKNGYYDETGTFKFEANCEYRFPILGYIHGAFFLDAGNVWLLKNDDLRPGGKLKGSTFLKDLAVGTGVGIRFDMQMLVVRGDLGIGIHAPYDTGKSGYYNMSSFKKSLAFHIAIGYPF